VAGAGLVVPLVFSDAEPRAALADPARMAYASLGYFKQDGGGGRLIMVSAEVGRRQLPAVGRGAGQAARATNNLTRTLTRDASTPFRLLGRN
jgi:NAD(P)-dependent dehydrogenase (short-subunit alcohol dehydrogenase family)